MKSQPEAKFVRGTALDEKALKHGKTFSVTYVPKLHYAWDTGEAIGRYLAELKEGRLIARACRKCERVMIPPRMFCERCFAELKEQVEVKRTGRLVSYTVCYVDHDGARLRGPVALGLVQLDGATTFFLHYLLGINDPREVKIGCRVETIIKAKAKRVGSILDIEGFRVLS